MQSTSLVLPTLDVGGIFGRQRLGRWAEDGNIFVLDNANPYLTPGITEQFLKDAAVYHDRYFAPSEFEGKIARAIEAVGWRIPEKPLALDFGSGSGNTMMPLLQLRDDLRVVAIDLSVDLLRILHRLLSQRQGVAGRFACVCGNLDTSDLGSGVFDMVVGSAILHHLLHPRAALKSALKALKPGGIAIFFEPFEYGCLLLNVVYLTLLDQARARGGLPDPVRSHFQAMVRDYNARFDAGTEKPHTPYLDDKWLFTRDFFISVAEELDLRAARIDPAGLAFETMLSDYVKATMGHAGLSADALPAWADEELARIDGQISPDLKREALIEGTITFIR
jgi:SAM-dependent methyltransferase